mmetsp:Transcript_75810/g.209205  ORF Transcript_75810/g.209205 Transcript_75810/m.209205 type:complete len:147 (+) Transcript_75810:170-610(+)
MGSRLLVRLRGVPLPGGGLAPRGRRSRRTPHCRQFQCSLRWTVLEQAPLMVPLAWHGRWLPLIRFVLYWLEEVEELRTTIDWVLACRRWCIEVVADLAMAEEWKRFCWTLGSMWAGEWTARAESKCSGARSRLMTACPVPNARPWQ